MNKREKELFELFKAMLTQVSKLNLVNLDVQCNTYFNKDFSFELSVFNRNGKGNTFYSFYTFWDQKYCIDRGNKVIDCLKKDNYSMFEDLVL